MRLLQTLLAAAALAATALASTAALAGSATMEATCHKCGGSSGCPYDKGYTLAALYDVAMSRLKDNRLYFSNRHLACWAERDAETQMGICLYLRRTTYSGSRKIRGLRGHIVKALLQELHESACTRCGAVPIYFAYDNFAESHGELVVDCVEKRRCVGRC